MKRIFTSLCVLGLLSLLSIGCEELNTPTPVLSIEGQDILLNFTIDPVDIPGYHIFKEETFHENLDSLLEAYNFSTDRLESVILTSASVEITGPSDTMSLNYLDMVKITIYTPELGEVPIAQNIKIPSNVKEMELEILEGDMKNYLEAEEYILTVYGMLNTRTYEQRELEARIKYKYTMAPSL